MTGQPLHGLLNLLDARLDGLAEAQKGKHKVVLGALNTCSAHPASFSQTSVNDDDDVVFCLYLAPLRSLHFFCFAARLMKMNETNEGSERIKEMQHKRKNTKQFAFLVCRLMGAQGPLCTL